MKKAIVAASCLLLSACNEPAPVEAKPAPTLLEPQILTDALQQLARSQRNVYSTKVVRPLAVQRKLIEATEHWQEQHGLPIPAQMVRYSAEKFSESSEQVSFALKSLWPINSVNLPSTETEKKALNQVNQDPSKPFYGEEIIDGKRYFTAVYADTASGVACVLCHNEHPDSPKKDFTGGDVLGGFVVRVALEP